MILLIHNNKQVVEVEDLSNNNSIEFSNLNPIETLFSLADEFRDSILVWCHEEQKDNLNLKGLSESFHLKNMMMSYSANQYMPMQIGYVEDSPFLKVNKKVKYPTWLMSSQVGAIHGSQLLKFKDAISTKNNFDYALNSIAKLGIVKGLFCYSEPNLLNDSTQFKEESTGSLNTLFKFVKQHYRLRWVFLLLLNIIWHDKVFPLLRAIGSLFYSNRQLTLDFKVEAIKPNQNEDNSSIDVIIPTIGRKQYLHDVLKDLSSQTLLPTNVIIVEQNPDSKSLSELDFIKNESWPYKIIHQFTHQTGACNARNIALNKVESAYVFLADDDIRFSENTLQDAVNCMHQNKFNAVTLSCLNPGDVEAFNNYFQWASFGSGCSLVKKDALTNCTFNMAFEFGYGEDAEFGMQLRNKGIDVFYVPDVKLIHLRAPIGGFRTKFIHPWEQERIQPKPFPTVMLNKLNNTTKHQLLGYKTTLFIKFYKSQNIKNPISYFKNFKKQWKQSVYWANKLKEDNS